MSALRIAVKGLAVFPCKPDKSPLTRHGHKDATTEPVQIRNWWSDNPEALIGIPTGAAQRMFALDVDLPDGPKTLAALEAQHEALPQTAEQRTGSGGRHLFFKWPSDGRVVPNSAGKLGPGLDVRGAGGYVIVAPSVSEKGAYEIVHKGAPVEAPEWLLNIVCGRKQPTDECSKRLGTVYGRAALDGELSKLKAADNGTRNSQLNKSAFVLGQLVADGQLAREEVESLLLAQADSMGLTETESVKTIASGLTKGAQKPRTAKDQCCEFSQVGQQVIEDDWTPTARPWPVLADAASPGLVGDFVRLATRNSEADPAAVLATFLVRFGCEVTGHCPGQGPYMMVGDTIHKPRLFAAIVGNSSKARKGTSAGPVKSLFTFNDFDAYAPATCSPGPLSSGEGLIYAVRDEVPQWQIDKKTGAGQNVIIDPGVPDKRLFVLDEELAAALHSTKREGNILSTSMREFWDSGNSAPMTKANRIKATGAHVCVVTHITNHELAGLMDNTQAFNGFGNRFLWVCAKRQGCVPIPEPMPEGELSTIRKQVLDRIKAAQAGGEMHLGNSARELWGEAYETLSQDHPGLAGCVINRAEAQTIRLAMIYALLDGAMEIKRAHVQSALAFWDYCRESALYIFGGRDVDPLVEKVIKALRDGELTTTELHKALAGHVSAERLKATLETMVRDGRVDVVRSMTGGRPKNLFRLRGKSEESEERGIPCPGHELTSHNSLNSLERETNVTSGYDHVGRDVQAIDMLS